MPVSRTISRMPLPCRCNTRISNAPSAPTIRFPLPFLKGKRTNLSGGSDFSRQPGQNYIGGNSGHDYPDRFRVWITGQVRRVTASIRREMRRRAAIEPVIGHLKAEHRMDRNYLKGFVGDRANAVLAVAGYNFRLLLRWLALLLRALIQLTLF